jgi:hypothetical protein
MYFLLKSVNIQPFGYLFVLETNQLNFNCVHWLYRIKY